MKICLITLCRNEESLVPYFLNHYQDWVDEIVVFDNESEDRTVELFNQCPKVSRVVSFSTGGYYKEEILTSIRNDAFRMMGLSADWFIIVDMDEFVYHPFIKQYLDGCEKSGVTVPRTYAFDMYADSCPLFDGKQSLRQRVTQGMRNPNYDKPCIVHRSVTKMNYGYGSHRANPEGKAVFSDIAEIILLHFKGSNISIAHTPRVRYPWGRGFSYIFTGRSQANERQLEREECLKYALPVEHSAFIKFLKPLNENLSAATPHQLHQVSLAYFTGHHVKINYSTSYTLGVLSAQKGNPDAQYHVGMLCRLGLGVPQDRLTATQWLNLAAQAGHTKACFQLGITLMPDKSALPWFEKAAENGHTEAQLRIAQIYENGLCGTEQSPDQFLKWLEKAAQKGCPRSAYELTKYHDKKGNFALAYQWAKMSANRSYYYGYEYLEASYQAENPFPAGSKDAVEWYQDRLLWLQNMADSPNFNYYDKMCPFVPPKFKRKPIA